jgi:predicted nucleic acid-binding protein
VKVVDASAMIDLLIGSERADQLASILDDDLFAPDLLITEVFAFLRRMTARSSISPAAADELADVFRSAPVEYMPVWPHAQRVWALRHTVSPYDASYVAVAEDLGTALVTTDVHLARGVAGVVPVIVV